MTKFDASQLRGAYGAGFADGVALLHELVRGEPVIVTAGGDEQCEHG